MRWPRSCLSNISFYNPFRLQTHAITLDGIRMHYFGEMKTVTGTERGLFVPHTAQFNLRSTHFFIRPPFLFGQHSIGGEQVNDMRETGVTFNLHSMLKQGDKSHTSSGGVPCHWVTRELPGYRAVDDTLQSVSSSRQ